MSFIPERYLPKKKIYEVLYYSGNDWASAKTYDAFDASDAAEKYAEDYYDECRGDWCEDSEILLNIREQKDDIDNIEKIAVSFQYTPHFYTRKMDDNNND